MSMLNYTEIVENAALCSAASEYPNFQVKIFINWFKIFGIDGVIKSILVGENKVNLTNVI